jgi:hypothetical protein
MKLPKPFRRPTLEFASVTYSDQSLSVVLPVYNAQNSLPQLISQMLDILPDVASEFEVLVVDDGSTDQTEEVARDLAIRYPQVRVARHAERLGGEAVIRTGYERSRGRVVIVQQENTAFGHADLKRLWQMHAEQPETTPDVHPTGLDSATEDYLTAWSAAFRSKMRPPSLDELDAMVAEMPENPSEALGQEAEYLRTDQAAAARPGSTRFFGPAQPRSRSTRR